MYNCPVEMKMFFVFEDTNSTLLIQIFFSFLCVTFDKRVVLHSESAPTLVMEILGPQAALLNFLLFSVKFL